MSGTYTYFFEGIEYKQSVFTYQDIRCFKMDYFLLKIKILFFSFESIYQSLNRALP